MSDNRASNYRGYTDARRKANAKYIAQFAEIKVRVNTERRDAIKAAADLAGESINAYINEAINQRMERDIATHNEQGQQDGNSEPTAGANTERAAMPSVTNNGIEGQSGTREERIDGIERLTPSNDDIFPPVREARDPRDDRQRKRGR